MSASFFILSLLMLFCYWDFSYLNPIPKSLLMLSVNNLTEVFLIGQATWPTLMLIHCLFLLQGLANTRAFFNSLSELPRHGKRKTHGTKLYTKFPGEEIIQSSNT